MSVISQVAIAVLIGGAFAGGLLSILAALPRWRAVSLSARIAPYVRDVVDDAHLPASALPRVGALPIAGRSLWQRAKIAFERLLGGGDALRHRLSQAGIMMDAAA
ncbi:MAG TPA: type II secretion protein F, partial [Microbacterium sp.]|nr:type II secretion protein F [Microbacterium sp.]